jgi:hypothetical protein
MTSTYLEKLRALKSKKGDSWSTAKTDKTGF